MSNPHDFVVGSAHTDHYHDLAVTCRIGPQTYAVALQAVAQVTRLPALMILAGAPPDVCGLLNLRGQLVPVLDGRIMLQEPPRQTLDTQIIVLGTNEHPVLGLLVDEVISVQRFDGVFTPITNAAPILSGVVRDGQTTVMLLNTDALLARAQDAVPQPLLN